MNGGLINKNTIPLRNKLPNIMKGKEDTKNVLKAYEKGYELIN